MRHHVAARDTTRRTTTTADDECTVRWRREAGKHRNADGQLAVVPPAVGRDERPRLDCVSERSVRAHIRKRGM